MIMNTKKIDLPVSAALLEGLKSEKQYYDSSNYISPQVEVIQIDVEKGFSSSDGGNESYEKEPGVWD